MKNSKLRKGAIVTATFLFFFYSTQSVAFLGLGKKVFDAGSMIPYLQKQVQESRKILRTANRQLGELKSMQRGARNIRKYATDSYDSPYMQIMKEVDGVEEEVDGILSGGSDNVYTFDNLPEGLKRAYEKRKRQEAYEAQKRKKEFKVAKKGDVSADYTEDVTLYQLEKDRKELRRNSDRSNSLSESAKITNEGLSLILESNTESLRIQKEQLKLQSAKYLRELKQEQADQSEGLIDEIIIQNAFAGELR
jgi:hypothetical protein